MFPALYAATYWTTKFFQSQQGTNFVEVKWTDPIFQPLRYKVTLSCRVFHEDTNYRTQERFLKDSKRLARFHGLRQNSTCEATLKAEYNPASLDPGIKIIANTLIKGQWK